MSSRHRPHVAAAVVTLTAAVLVTGCARADRPGTVSALPVAPAATTLPAPDPVGPPDWGPFASATVTVPGWGPEVTTCPSGPIRLTDGYAFDQAMNRSVFVMRHAVADVDRDGVDDYVADVRCGEGPESPGWQVVAFRRSGQALVPIGRIVGSQDGLAMVSGVEARDAGRVAVNLGQEYTDSGEDATPHQWRTYAWTGGRFAQVDGPTSFPADPPAAALWVFPAELAFRTMQGGGVAGELTAHVYNSGTAGVAAVRLALILPREVSPAGSAWDGCTLERFDREGTVRIDCLLGPLPAHEGRSITVGFRTDAEPWIQADRGEGYQPSDRHMWIEQRPPYTFRNGGSFEAAIAIVRR